MGLMQDLDLFISGNLEKSASGYLIFFIACLFFGLLVFITDLCYVTMNGGKEHHRSFLGLEYGGDWHKKLILLIAYVFGSGCGGLILMIGNILNFNIQGAAGAGIGWLVILPRLFHSMEEGQPEQKKEQEDD